MERKGGVGCWERDGELVERGSSLDRGGGVVVVVDDSGVFSRAEAIILGTLIAYEVYATTIAPTMVLVCLGPLLQGDKGYFKLVPGLEVVVTGIQKH